MSLVKKWGSVHQRSRDWIKLGFRCVLGGPVPQQRLCHFDGGLEGQMPEAPRLTLGQSCCLLCGIALQRNWPGRGLCKGGQCLGPGGTLLFLYLILRTSFLREAEKEQIWQNRPNLLSKARFNSFRETRSGGLHLPVGSQAAGGPDQKNSKGSRSSEVQQGFQGSVAPFGSKGTHWA